MFSEPSEAFIWPVGFLALHTKSTLACSLSLLFIYLTYSIVSHISSGISTSLSVAIAFPKFSRAILAACQHICQRPCQGATSHIMGEHTHIDKFSQTALYFISLDLEPSRFPYIFFSISLQNVLAKFCSVFRVQLFSQQTQHSLNFRILLLVWFLGRHK